MFYALILLPNSSANDRVSNNTILNQAYLTDLSQTTDQERRLSLSSDFISLFENKPLALVEDRVITLFNIFELRHLFWFGNAGLSGFAVWKHGYFYVFDAVLLITGAGALLYFRRTKQAVLIDVWLTLGTIPSLINPGNEWHIFRSLFSYTALGLVISLGWWLIWSSLPRLRYVAVAIYAAGIMLFVFQFFWQFPLYATNGNYHFWRVTTSYLNRANQSARVYISNPEVLSMGMAFYSGKLGNWQAVPSPNRSEYDWLWQQVTFTTGCVLAANDQQLKLIEPNHKICDQENTDNTSPLENSSQENMVTSIASVLDSGSRLIIENDTLCSQYELRSYINPRHRFQLNVEKLSNQEFCETWLVRQPE